jgi:cytochrome b subunit of formate dehydrogenase
MKDRDVKRLVIWLLGGVTILFLVTGFGITAQDLVTPLTLGVLSKSVAYQLHTYLWGPFVILFLLHIYLAQKKSPRN